MEDGWRLSEIDSMDMLGFFHVRAWKARREAEKKNNSNGNGNRISDTFGNSTPKYIDEVWTRVKP